MDNNVRRAVTVFAGEVVGLYRTRSTTEASYYPAIKALWSVLLGARPTLRGPREHQRAGRPPRPGALRDRRVPGSPRRGEAAVRTDRRDRALQGTQQPDRT